MSFIIDERAFGEVEAHVEVTKFQRRGLLHAQCILYKAPISKVRLFILTFVDRVILSKISNKRQPL